MHTVGSFPEGGVKLTTHLQLEPPDSAEVKNRMNPIYTTVQSNYYPNLPLEGLFKECSSVQHKPYRVCWKEKQTNFLLSFFFVCFLVS
jgi:hypothetical protein